MVSRRELIELLAELAGPLGPLGFEGAPSDTKLFCEWLDQRSRDRWRPMLDDAVDAFIDIVQNPPLPQEYSPHAGDLSSFQVELCLMAEAYEETPHIHRIIEALKPVSELPTRGEWARDVLEWLKESKLFR